MMVEALRNSSKMASWLEKGGDAALASYGGDPAAVPQAHIAWLDQLGLMHLDTHRLYVHAGVDPGIPLNEQSETTLLWKRYPKGFSGGFGGRHVVHGHDNFPDGPLLYEGRTNLDTLGLAHRPADGRGFRRRSTGRPGRFHRGQGTAGRTVAALGLSDGLSDGLLGLPVRRVSRLGRRWNGDQQKRL